MVWRLLAFGNPLLLGDSFVGAMTLGLSRGMPPEEAFVLGMAAGSAAAATSGTEVCRMADVERLHGVMRREQGRAPFLELVCG